MRLLIPTLTRAVGASGPAWIDQPRQAGAHGLARSLWGLGWSDSPSPSTFFACSPVPKFLLGARISATIDKAVRPKNALGACRALGVPFLFCGLVLSLKHV